MSDRRYTVLSMNIAGYEVIHPVKEKSDRARYIMVTDDPNLKDDSGTWEIVYDDTLTGSAFDKVLQVRYNPFKYTDDYIVIKIDGSVGVEKNLDPLVDRFEKDGFDMSLMSHPTRMTMVEEYTAWVQTRGYDPDRANYVLAWMAQAEGYNVRDFKGLAQLCFWMQCNNRLNNDLNRLVYAWCKYLGDNRDEIERVDQCVFSMLCQKYFANAKIMWVDQRIYNGNPFQWYPHNSTTPFRPMDVKEMKEPYWHNKRLHNPVRPQDL